MEDANTNNIPIIFLGDLLSKKDEVEKEGVYSAIRYGKTADNNRNIPICVSSENINHKTYRSSTDE